MNAVEIEQAVSDLFEQPFDAEEFPYQFLEAFGNKPATIKRLRKGGTNKSDVAGGVLQRNNIHIAVCDPGMVDATMPALRESPATRSQKAKFILATDGEMVHAESLLDDAEPPLICAYAKVSDHFGYFLELAGITTVKQIRENAFDIKATSRLNKLYIELLRENPDWGTPERRENLRASILETLRLDFGGEASSTAAVCRFTSATRLGVSAVVQALIQEGAVASSRREIGVRDSTVTLRGA